ncbi:MAG: hypothetical protein OXR62_15540 [Ahrensia sp.]|nr:hypothetical protein [Ahrensia sp.]
MDKLWPATFETYTQMEEDEREIARIQSGIALLDRVYQNTSDSEIVSSDSHALQAGSEVVLTVGQSVRHPVYGDAKIDEVDVVVSARKVRTYLSFQIAVSGERVRKPVADLLSEGMQLTDVAD